MLFPRPRQFRLAAPAVAAAVWSCSFHTSGTELFRSSQDLPEPSTPFPDTGGSGRVLQKGLCHQPHAGMGKLLPCHTRTLGMTFCRPPLLLPFLSCDAKMLWLQCFRAFISQKNTLK